MGFRFRRSMKIAPGIRLNFSKSGVSTTIGGKGAKVTIGSKGTRTTFGVPGTGLSFSRYERRGKSYSSTPGSSSGSPSSGFLFALGVGTTFVAMIGASSGNTDLLGLFGLIAVTAFGLVIQRKNFIPGLLVWRQSAPKRFEQLSASDRLICCGLERTGYAVSVRESSASLTELELVEKRGARVLAHLPDERLVTSSHVDAIARRMQELGFPKGFLIVKDDNVSESVRAEARDHDIEINSRWEIAVPI